MSGGLCDPLRPGLTRARRRGRITMFYRMNDMRRAPNLCDQLGKHAGGRRISSPKGSAALSGEMNETRKKVSQPSLGN
jgi:hypothetical protein